MNKKKKAAKETLTYGQALSALEVINPTQRVQGQVVKSKSDLTSIKGDVGMQVYHLKHDLIDATKVYDDKREDIIEDLKKLKLRLNEIEDEAKEEEDKKKPKKVDDSKPKKDLSKEEIKPKVTDLMDELRVLNEVEIELTYTKGKLKLSQITHALDADEYEILKFAIIDDTK
jgi:hypothetical protein